MTAKELLEKIKAVFNMPAPVAAPVAVAPAAAAEPEPAPAVPAAPKAYKLKDGTDISIAQAGEVVAVGDTVTVGGAPAAAGDHILEDGSTISVDAAGKIISIAPAAPVTNDLSAPAAAAPVAVAPIVQPIAASAQTPEQLNALIASFSNGTPEERISKLEVVCKALMESCMGYELREAERKTATEQAIEIYKTDLKSASFAAQEKVEKHEKTIASMFELIEMLVKEPSTDPKTLTGNKKEIFEKASKREKRMEQFADAIADLKNNK